jgi:acyl carrier protein phosphodiesterase
VNYLAHLYLAGDNPAAQLGNLMGDFLKGPIPDTLSPELAAGVRLHRRIDSYTDRHACFRASRRRLARPLQRYGGIIVDVIYDHLLARDWADHHPEPLVKFATQVYQSLDAQKAEMPPGMRRRVQGMIDSRLLEAYAEEATVAAALERIAQRLKRPVPLGAAGSDLSRDRTGFEADFAEFFPQLKAFVQRVR